MLIKLLPEQTAKYWPMIKESLENTIPGEYLHKHARLNNILELLIADKMHCWWSVEEKDGNFKLFGVLITTFFNDDCTKTRNLRIYSVFGYEDIPFSEWEEGFKTIVEFARAKNCSYVDAFTDIPGVVAIAKRFNWEARFTYLSKEVS